MRLRLAVLLAIALPAAVWAADSKKSATAEKPKDPPGLVHMSAEQQKTVGLDTVAAQRQPITEPVRVPGSVAYDPGHVALLRPFGQSRVVRLLVQPGEVVAANQVVAEFEMQGLIDVQQQLAASRATVREAQAGVAVARAALDRAVVLSRDGSLARAEADRRRLVLAQAVAAQETAQARVASLQVELDRLNPLPGAGLAGLRSPIDGIVVTTGITPGEVIGPTTEAMTVADLRTVMVLGQVSESDVTKVAVGDAASVRLAGDPGRSWTGRVATLGAQLNPQAHTLPARITIQNLDLALRIGMYVDVVVNRTLNRESVVVPATAVQVVADKDIVFTPEAGDGFQSHEVETGVRRQESIEIRRGLADGARVVTTGSFQLKALLQQSMLGGD